MFFPELRRHMCHLYPTLNICLAPAPPSARRRGRRINQTMGVKHTASHWGAIRANVQDGRLISVEPFDKDRNPSPIIGSMAGAVYDQTRILQPMVRAGYLAKGIASDRSRRGAEPFVPVSWDRALHLVETELQRVKSEFGNEAIYGGSYGWGS